MLIYVIIKEIYSIPTIVDAPYFMIYEILSRHTHGSYFFVCVTVSNGKNTKKHVITSILSFKGRFFYFACTALGTLSINLVSNWIETKLMKSFELLFKTRLFDFFGTTHGR